MSKVKSNKALFLNNKLDDLLAMFGDRRCKSLDDQILRMYDDDMKPPHAWDAYDERVTQTAPLDAETKKLYRKVHRFRPEDVLGDGREMNDAATGMGQQIQEALNRN